MKITYSVGTRLKGGGFGNTAYYEALGMERNDLLENIFATGFENNNIPVYKYRSVSLPTRFESTPFLKDNLFDFIVSQKLKKEVDFLHVWAHFGLLSMKKAKKLGMRTILVRASSHVLTQSRLLSQEYKKWRVSDLSINPLIVKKQLEEYKIADYIFVPSPFSFQSFLDNGYPQEKLKLLPFGVDLERFKPSERISSESKFRVLFVGQISLRKGVQYLLSAWQKLALPNSELTLLGTVMPDFQGLKKEYAGISNVRFVNFTDPLPYYQNSDLFVFPSIEEGSALVTYEAMACGLPSIVTFESGSLVDDQKEGFIVKSGDVSALAERIKFCSEHWDSVRQMGKRAREKVENYSWESYGKRVAQVYESF